MPSSTRQPSVEPVRNRGCIRYGDEQGPIRPDDAADLAQRSGEIAKVLKAVVGDYQVKAAIRERQVCRVGLDEVGPDWGA